MLDEGWEGILMRVCVCVLYCGRGVVGSVAASPCVSIDVMVEGRRGGLGCWEGF